MNIKDLLKETKSPSGFVILDVKDAKELYEEIKGLRKLEHKQNTINDFYKNDVDMFISLVELFTTKIEDSMKKGETYTYSRMLEIIGFASRYVLTFVKGKDFQGKH